MIRDVVLYRVGRNLNRSIRAAYTAGAARVRLVECVGRAQGNLYAAATLPVETAPALPAEAVWLEVDGNVPLGLQDWSACSAIVVGGESSTLPRRPSLARCRIPTAATLCHTTEAALAIAFYAAARPRREGELSHVGWGCWRSRLPSRQVIQDAARHGVRHCVDLTRRDRPNVTRWCRAAGMEYLKVPVDYDGDVAPALAACALLRSPFLVHCFHGRDRTGRFVASWLESNRPAKSLC